MRFVYDPYMIMYYSTDKDTDTDKETDTDTNTDQDFTLTEGKLLDSACARVPPSPLPFPLLRNVHGGGRPHRHMRRCSFFIRWGLCFRSCGTRTGFRFQGLGFRV